MKESMNIRNLKGLRFGRLVVVEQTEFRNRGSVLWKCRCDCGNELIAPSSKLAYGRKQSCGCLRIETSKRTAKTGNNRRTHGMKHTKLYQVWNMIKYRCHSPKYPQWKDYGGRGIAICEEWSNSFQAFYDYVSQLPHFGEEGYSIDRINNDGNYEPGNVRWATRTEQNRNRRNCKHGT